MSFEIPGVVWRRDPEAAEVPLVFDSPHSGSHYPEDFRFACPLDRGEGRCYPCELSLGGSRPA